MSVLFRDKDHAYFSEDPAEKIDWVGVTTLVSRFKEPFDEEAVAAKVIKNPKSKWFGLTKDGVLKIWKDEGNRGIDLGKFYHDQRESEITSFNTVQRKGVEIPIIRPIFRDDIKVAPNQKLTDGLYPEHFVYLKSAGLCGQSDRVEVIDGTVHVYDYKTNKEIKRQGFKNWEGITKKMLRPLRHLDDCELTHYTLQLSTYMYIILKHNPRLKVGELVIEHVTFEEEGKNEYGYPIAKLDADDNPIVKSVEYIKVPYLRDDVRTMINWLHDNRDKATRR